MDKLNVAYDLSLYEEYALEQEQNLTTKPKDGKAINVKKKLNTGRALFNTVSSAVMIALVVAILMTNANVTTCVSEISATNKSIQELEANANYLNIELENRVSFAEVEKYAENTLGLVKMESSQVKYVNLEDENLITRTDKTIQEKINDKIQPVLSYLLP